MKINLILFSLAASQVFTANAFGQEKYDPILHGRGRELFRVDKEGEKRFVEKLQKCKEMEKERARCWVVKQEFA